MAVWLVNAGLHSQYEAQFFQEARIYLVLDFLHGDDFTDTPDYAGIRKYLLEKFDGADDKDLANLSDMVFEFVLGMNSKDYVLMPRKTAGTLAIGEITSPYGFDPNAESPFTQLRDVRWLATEVPSTSFNSSVQQYLTYPQLITQIKVSDAAHQIQRALGRPPEVVLVPEISASSQIRLKPPAPEETQFNPPAPAPAPAPAIGIQIPAPSRGFDHSGETLEAMALNAVRAPFEAALESMGIEALIRDILKAGGLTTIPLEERDSSGLFMVAAGAFGLDRPKTCVRVHPLQQECDALAFSQFFGTMQGFQADQGLLVSWRGFHPQVQIDARAQGARIRLWDQSDIISQFLSLYPSMSVRWRQSIRLKNIWIPDEMS
jgi:restriction system protein